MSDEQLINRSLENLAERDIDITPDVYQRFFAACPEAKPLFSSTAAAGAHGRMIYELLQIVMDRLKDEPCLPTLMETTVNDHKNWGATGPMYGIFLDAFMTSLRDNLGEAWDRETEAAWKRQVDWMLQQVGRNIQ